MSQSGSAQPGQEPTAQLLMTAEQGEHGCDI